MSAIYDLLDEMLPAETGAILAIQHGFEPPAYSATIATIGADSWCRVSGFSQPPVAWLDSKTKYNTILAPLPKGKGSLELALANAANHLADGGVVYLFGLNEFGIKSSDKVAKQYFKTVETFAIGGKGRIFTLQSPLRQNHKLADFEASSSIQLGNSTQDFSTYPGLFAKGKLDEATALLLEHLPEIKPDADVLDYACGIGVLGKAALLKQPECRITAVDYDPLAVLAAQKNLPAANVLCTASPAQVEGGFDLIISNPPIHEAQELSYRIVSEMVAVLRKQLKLKGSAYFVTQVTVPVARIAAESKLKCAEVAASRAFRVTKISA